MAVIDNGRITDDVFSVEGGVDAGFAPSLLLPNEVAWGVNSTVRGGWGTCRPGWVSRSLQFGGDSYLEFSATDGLFQGAGGYISPRGIASIAYQMSGRQFLINLQTFRVSEITIPGDPNMATRPHAWFQQAENWLVIQNNLNPAFLYNGSVRRRAGDLEVPVGGPMAYGKGRLWVARDSLFWGSDLVGSHPELGRDSIIRFEENTYLNEGGAFSVEAGPINGMAFVGTLDTGLGVGDLLVSTSSNVHAFDAPVDRDVWKDLRYPILRYAAREFGSLNHESMVNVNSDVFYRATDGVRSLAYARRDSAQWGNTPISRQVLRALQHDTEARLGACSAANFDNRLLMTIQPQRDPVHGIWHRGLVVLDFHLTTGIGRKLAPAWEGVWTGVRILQIVTVKVHNIARCFLLALSEAGRLQLWEVTKSRAFDFDGTDDRPIEWALESRGMTFGRPKEKKRLMGGNQWVDSMLGEVRNRVLYRPDDSPCWHPWQTWNECVAYRNCDEALACPGDPYSTYQPVRNYRNQQRPRIGLGQPPDVVEGQTGGYTRDGYFFQFRYEMSGKFRIKMLEAVAQRLTEDLYGDMRNTTCDNPGTGDCQTGDCPGNECCDPDDFTYRLSGQQTGGQDPDPPTTYPYPGDDGDGDGGGGEEPDPDPAPLIEFDVQNQLGFPAPPDHPQECIVYVESNYVWSFTADVNPDQQITAAQLACAAALLDAEVAANIASYESMGNTAVIATPRKWVYYPQAGVYLAGFRKGTCDPFDGIDDHLVSFSGYSTVVQGICVT